MKQVTPIELLRYEGAIGTRDNKALRSILGCLGCKNMPDGVYGHGVSVCTGASSSAVNVELIRLKSAGVVEEQEVDSPLGGRPRFLFSPASTEIGQKLAQVLVQPENCGLEPDRQSPDSEITNR